MYEMIKSYKNQCFPLNSPFKLNWILVYNSSGGIKIER